MPTKANPDLLLAQTLAAPFTPRSQGSPLSSRRLPDGGMVVIAADGRKLWFSVAEVAETLALLKKQNPRPKPAEANAVPIKLAKMPVPSAQANNGFPLRVSISEDLKKKT